jgi:hypothetical protein
MYQQFSAVCSLSLVVSNAVLTEPFQDEADHRAWLDVTELLFAGY